MIKVMQTKLHSETVKGNCFAAAVASILEIPLQNIPEFEEMMEEDAWWFAFLKWVEGLDIEVVRFDNEFVFAGYYLAMGTSPRNPKINHQVVFKNGRLVHDPHPDGTGILDIKEVMIFVPLDITDCINRNQGE